VVGIVVAGPFAKGATMRVLLVGPDLESNLSLGYLSSSLQAAGHGVQICPFTTPTDTAAVLAAAQTADVVGLSLSFQVRAPEFLELARDLKRARPERPVIAGGHFATCAAAELLRDVPELDLVVLHEGERTLVELANLGGDLLARAGTVPGLMLRDASGPRSTAVRPSLTDLDALPPPDRYGPSRLVAGVPTAYVMASRGCVRSCDYCCITTLHRLAPGPRFRRRDPRLVVDELADLYYRRGVRQFVFHDDNFLVPSPAKNRERLAEYEEAIADAGLRDIGLVMKCGPQDLDPAALATLKSMGLIRIFLGIESGSQCGLDSIGRRQTTMDTERAVSLCEEAGISSQYTMIIFHPEATPGSMLADLDFVERHPAHPVNYCRAELYAGTPLERRMLEVGRARGSYMARTYEYTDDRVARIWEIGRDLFAGRCWGKDEILGQAIRLDHQVTVLRHFYEGPEVEALVRDFHDWQLRLNLETAGLFRELVVACAEATSNDAPALTAAVRSLAEREALSRAGHLAAVCALRGRIDGIVQPVIAFATSARPRARAPKRVPRHAMAVLVAAGLLGCGGSQRTDDGVMEAPPPPYDERLIVPDEGVAEAAPPPVDEPDGGSRWSTPPPPDGTPDAGTTQQQDQRQFMIDHGVAEAAPPPIDRPKK